MQCSFEITTEMQNEQGSVNGHMASWHTAAVNVEIGRTRDIRHPNSTELADSRTVEASISPKKSRNSFCPSRSDSYILNG